MAGSDTAIGTDQLFRAHAAYVRSFLYKLGISSLWIDDAVQDVFIVAHTCDGYHPGPASPRTWLGAIAIRVAANARRKQHRLSKVMMTHEDVASLLESPIRLGSILRSIK